MGQGKAGVAHWMLHNRQVRKSVCFICFFLLLLLVVVVLLLLYYYIILLLLLYRSLKEKNVSLVYNLVCFPIYPLWWFQHSLWKSVRYPLWRNWPGLSSPWERDCSEWSLSPVWTMGQLLPPFRWFCAVNLSLKSFNFRLWHFGAWLCLRPEVFCWLFRSFTPER